MYVQGKREKSSMNGIKENVTDVFKKKRYEN